MTRLELRVLIAGVLAATVILGAVMCAAYGQAAIAAALSIYALGVGAWLYHSVERLVLARRIETVRSAATPLRPLLPVMAAIMALTQAVVRSLSDATEVAPRRWIPITRGPGYEDTRKWVEQLSKAVGAVVPDLISWEWDVDKRGGRARLDYTQNVKNKTLVAPYSARPAAGAPVAAPIEWDELDDPDLRPDGITIRTVLDRLAGRGDPFRTVLGPGQTLPPIH